MTTTVRDLLDRLHQQAWTLTNPTDTTPRQPGEAAAIRAAWVRIGRHTTRLLHSLPFAPESTTRDHARVIIDTLEPIRDHPTPSPTAACRPLLEASVLIGAIADLVTPSAARVADDEGAGGLQTSVLAALYCAARWSVPRLTAETRNRPNRVTGALRKLVVLTEPFAAVPPGERVTNLEDLAATNPREVGLDAALLRWRHAVEDQLDHRYTMTSLGFQTIAADLAILTAGAIIALRAAGPEALAVPDLHRPALTALREAHQAWAGLSAWPEGVFLGGRTSHDLRTASVDLRTEVRTLLRDENGWVEREELWRRTPPADLLAGVRRTMAVAAGVATGYANTLTDHTVGCERPWIKAQSVPPAHRGPTENRAAAHDRWVPAPQGLVQGGHAQLAHDADRAREHARTALEVLFATNAQLTSASPQSAIAIQSGRLMLMGNPPWERVPPNVSPMISDVGRTTPVAYTRGRGDGWRP